MGIMGNPGPYGSPYGQPAGQGLGGTGLGPQLQNKTGLPSNLGQFNLDKKTPPMQGMAGMVSVRVPVRGAPRVVFGAALCVSFGGCVCQFGSSTKKVTSPPL